RVAKNTGTAKATSTTIRRARAVPQVDASDDSAASTSTPTTVPAYNGKTCPPSTSSRNGDIWFGQKTVKIDSGQAEPPNGPGRTAERVPRTLPDRAQIDSERPPRLEQRRIHDAAEEQPSQAGVPEAAPAPPGLEPSVLDDEVIDDDVGREDLEREEVQPEVARREHDPQGDGDLRGAPTFAAQTLSEPEGVPRKHRL